MKNWLYIIVSALFACMIIALSAQRDIIKRRTEERNRYQQNTLSLLSKIEYYKVQDSLNVAKVGALTLTIAEYKKYRTEDYAIIEKLRADKKRLGRITNTQSQTITELQNLPLRDSIIYIVDRQDTIRCIEYHDQWLDFICCQNSDGTGTARIISREELLCVEHVEYARFWGFLWRTKRIKSQDINIVSKNPRTEIVDIEHIIVK